MNANINSILIIVNLAATAGLAGWFISSGSQKNGAPAPAAVSAAVDLAPVTALSHDLRTLNTTLQRLNTSMIQYEFLDQELENLGTFERNIVVRARAIVGARTDANAAESDKAITELKAVLTKVQGERKARRQTMLLLISGLEKQLAGFSGAPTVSDKVPADPPPASEDPAPESGEKK